MKIYWAAPLFNLAEVSFNQAAARELALLGHEVYLPQDHEPREKTGRAVFETDVVGINSSEVVVALLDGADPDSGTCWECGYAYGKKPVVVVRTNVRSGDDPELGPCNLMPWHGCTYRIRAREIGAADVAEVARVVDEVLRGL